MPKKKKLNKSNRDLISKLRMNTQQKPTKVKLLQLIFFKNKNEFRAYG